MSLSEAATTIDFTGGWDTNGYLTLGQSGFGSISGTGGRNGDLDGYQIYLQAGVNYKALASGTNVGNVSAAGRMYLELFDSDGFLVSNFTPGTTGAVNADIRVSQTGFYLVRVSGDRTTDIGGYRVSVAPNGSQYADDHGGDFENASRLVSGNRYSGILERTADVDSFVINAAAESRYFFAVRSNVSDLFLVIDDSKHQRVLAETVNTTGYYYHITTQDAQAVRISFNSDGFTKTGSYSFGFFKAFSKDKALQYGTELSDNVTGMGGADELWGMAGNDSILGEEGDDVLVGNAGNDVMDGGTGNDTVGYLGHRARYTATLNSDGSVTLVDARVEGDGSDTVRNVETFEFANGTYTVEQLLASNNSAPTAISLGGTSVQEGAASGTVIGYLSTADVDAGEVFTYTLLDDAGGRFALQGNAIVAANGSQIDFERAQSHQVRVRVQDIGEHAIEQTFTINVVDVASENTVGSVGPDILVGGSGRDVLRGLGGNDTLDGGSSDDQIWGGLGKDVLTGGAGKDVFVFDYRPNKVHADRIVDFNVRDDSIYLENAIFKKLGKKGTIDKPAKVASKFFTVGSAAKDKDDYLIYNSKTGKLYYDENGSSSGKMVEIATLSKKLKLKYSDFLLI